MTDSQFVFKALYDFHPIWVKSREIASKKKRRPLNKGVLAALISMATSA